MTRAMRAAAPWAGAFLGIFGILVIASNLAAGIISLAGCVLLLAVPWGGAS